IYLEGDETSYDIQAEELEKVQLNAHEKEELSKVTDTISSLSFLNEDLRGRYLKNIINSFKAKKIRKGV
ncbi:MAG: hypothetical protein LUE64_02920, partial [Candidatus Gastranaerophilales bacterium]|nr:hypothetical protein [Candidatus Gastranaerophilales bacterium]